MQHTLASDKMSQINEPRLLLDLDVSGDKGELLQLDLGKDELKSLIDTMEKIKIVSLLNLWCDILTDLKKKFPVCKNLRYYYMYKN